MQVREINVVLASVADGQHELGAIDDPIRGMRKLTQIGIVELGHPPTGRGMHAKLLGACENAAHPTFGRERLLRGNRARDLLDALERHRGPDDAHVLTGRIARLRAAFARGGRGAQSRKDPHLRLAVRDALSGGDLRLCRPHIVGDFDPFQQRFVRIDRQQNRRTPPVLRQHERPLRALDVLNECGDTRAEFGQGANI